MSEPNAAPAVQDLDTEPEKRVRRMTEKGEEMFHQTCDDHKRRIDDSWIKVESFIMKFPTCDRTISALNDLERDITTSYKTYFQNSDSYMGYLSRANTEESKQEMDIHVGIYKKSKDLTDKILSEIKSARLDVVERMSLPNSDSSSLLARKKAKAEAQKTRLQYMAKEAELIKKKAQMDHEEATIKAAAARQKAEIEVDINLLKQQAEMAAADTEVKTLEEHDRGFEIDNNDFVPPQESVNRSEYTRSYVESICGDNTSQPRDTAYRTPSPPRPCVQPTPMYGQSMPTFANRGSTQPAVVSDLTQFLLRKDLLLTRFSNFDDLPESFSMWKATFRSIIAELNVPPFEEMDLLVKWLGPSSSKFARSIRAANANDPYRGLQSIWERLDERYGRPEMVESALKKKLSAFPQLTNKDSSKLYDLLDILTEVQSAMGNPVYSTLLAYFDSSSGVGPIVQKLPYGLQEKWTTQAYKYKKTHNVSFPPFTFFVNFIKDMSAVRNDPAFAFHSSSAPTQKKERTASTPTVISRKSDVSDHRENKKRCPIHKAGHTLNECKGFMMQPIEERRKFLLEKRLCFRCCLSDRHKSKNCDNTDLTCSHCGSKSHPSAMHVDKPAKSDTASAHGGELDSANDSIVTKCTSLCGQGFQGRSCGKTMLVDVYPKGHAEKAVRVYAIIDDQATGTLGKAELFDTLGIDDGPKPYSLKSCSGETTMVGRRARGLIVQCVDSSDAFELPVVIECDDIPNETSEIATPEVAMSYPHLQRIASSIHPLDTRTSIQLLIGRDLPEVHYVKDQIIGPKGTPFAQKLALGWSIIGEVCLGRVHKPDVLNVNKTCVMSDGRGTVFTPCKYNIHVKDLDSGITHARNHDYKGDSVFIRSADDDQIGQSVEDKEFVRLMDSEFHKDDQGRWTAPLPFRSPRVAMPNNRPQVWRRAQYLDASLRKDPVKKQHFFTFMTKVLDSGAAEVAPGTPTDDCWYLPLFGVYHPRKPDQIRGVFDSSAVYEGVSLNSTLMSGPDLTNNLLGILLRFRKDKVAVMADVEQMFYQFYVREDHRDYLRFFWYKDNEFDSPLIEYRTRVHVFGNSPSPSIATYGLRKTVANADEDVRAFVSDDFYVDDALTSLPTSSEAVGLMLRTQASLKDEGRIRLHKIASNSADVMSAFPVEDLEKNLKCLTLGEDTLPLQHSLGMSWDLNDDCFVFSVIEDDKPYTRRGLLSTVNSLYDPVGFIAPITISGKILLRDVTPSGTDWDEPLSELHQRKWKDWLVSLHALRDIKIPRMCVPLSLSLAKTYEVHIFSDASELAIAAVAYMKVMDAAGSVHLGFLMGKAKLAPSKGHTIPRLELCGAVLATEIAEILSRQLSIDLTAIRYHTDSKVVLGYIGNLSRRFYTYVSNRVERIHKISSPSQWSYVPTHRNPADSGTRRITSVVDLSESPWITGPVWLREGSDSEEREDDSFPLIDPENDKELKPEVVVQKTSVRASPGLSMKRFERFSTWRSAVRAVTFLRRVARSRKTFSASHNDRHVSTDTTVTEYQNAEMFLLKKVQRECFGEEIACLSTGKRLPRTSSIISLCPILDNDGVLRVGGRISRIKGYIPNSETNPVILPKGNHISVLLIRHHHEAVTHQGRHLTEGAVRSAGLWIIGAKRMITSMIHNCVMCRKLRRSTEYQKMADLPQDRITPMEGD